MKDKIIAKVNHFIEDMHTSFKDPSLTKIFKIDFITLFIAVIFIAGFLLTVNFLSTDISQGMTSEELSAGLLDSSPEELNDVLIKIKVLVLFLVIVGPIILLAISLIYGYSRHKLIDKLQDHKSKKSLSIKDFIKKKWIWSWLWLIILLSIIFTLSTFIYLFLKYGLVFIYVIFWPQKQMLWEQITYFLNFIYFIYLLFTLFIIEQTLVKTHKTWESISVGFSSIFKNFGKTSLSVITSGIILTLIHFIIIYPASLFLGHYWILFIQLIIAVLFLSWSRIYFLQIIGERKNKHHKEQKHKKEE